MSKISFGFRTAYNFLQRESFPGRDGRTVPNCNRIVYAKNYESKKKGVRDAYEREGGRNSSGDGGGGSCTYGFSHRG
jgi:hypothetical protein